MEVSVGDNVIDYGENAIIILEFNQRATGTVNITLAGKKHEINIKDEELKGSFLISGLRPDEYIITVSYSGDENFKPETKTANTTLTVNKAKTTVTKTANTTLTVNKAKTTVNIKNATTQWNVPINIPISVEGAEGVPVTGMVIVTVDWAKSMKPLENAQSLQAT